MSSSPTRPAAAFESLTQVARVVVLTVLALLSVWRAPLPWIHQHVGLSGATVEQPSLIEHLGTSHVENLESDWFGWHFHWVLPGHTSDEDCPRNGNHGSQSTVMDEFGVQSSHVELLTRMAALATSFDSFGMDEFVSELSLLELSSTVPAHSFLQTFAAAVPLRAMTGVLRC